MEIVTVSLVLLVAVFLLITEKLPVELTAVGILGALTVTGILSPEEALAGFSNTSVVTIGALFVLSAALVRTGALAFVSQRIVELSKGRERRVLLLGMGATALLSAFINNTPVVILFATVIMSVCCEFALSPSKFLIPISYISIFGGLSTLIGTSTNLIVSDLSTRAGYGGISMFELVPIGVPLLLMALVVLTVLAPRFMPNHKAPVCELSGKDIPHYLTEVAVPAESRLVGADPLEVLREKYPDVELFEVVRGPAIHFPDREALKLLAGDLLFLKGTVDDLVSLFNEKLVELPHEAPDFRFNPRDERSLVAELIIPPQSSLVGEVLLRSDLHRERDLHIIAVKRRGIHYSEQKIRDLTLTVGDVLLIYCTRDKLEELRVRTEVVVLEDVHHRIVNRKRAPVALAIFGAMIAAATAGIAHISVCAVTAVFLMVISGCIRLRTALRAIDTQVLLMLVGAIALGVAMEKTGAAALYAKGFLSPLRGQSPAVVLSALILFTCVLTELMSNAATAVLLVPVAISTALSLGVDPKPFIIGVCVGASCGFAVPIGYQTHLIVYGPGGYRSTDFLKLGVPLDLMTWSFSSIMIPVIWPF